MGGPSQKGSVLVITMWALVILALLAISGGRQVSMAIKMSDFRKQKLEAYCRAKTALNDAIARLEKDLSESEDARPAEAGALDPEENQPEISDEESKVNLNSASEELLLALFRQCGLALPKAQELTEDLIAWRGSRQASPALVSYYQDTMGYSCKQGPLSVLEEMDLIKGFLEIESQAAKKIRDCVTLEGAGKVNINTASEDVLGSLASAAAFLIQKTSPDVKIGEADIRGFAQAIFNERGRGAFLNRSEMNPEGFRLKFGFDEEAKDNRTKIAETLLSSGYLTTQSDFFRIRAAGTSGKAVRTLTVIYDRNTKKIQIVL